MVADAQMTNPKIDSKNIELLKLIAQLRDHIGVHRIIGLNVTSMRASTISAALLGHLQKSAQEALTIYICKIFESSNRNDLNSIPGIIESLSPIRLSDNQKREFATFGQKHDNHTGPTEAKSYLKSTFGLFCDIHSESLGRLKKFRNTIGAHSDSNANIRSLPSPHEVEILFDFSKDFYELISHSINNGSPAPIPRKVGHGFIKLLKSLGIPSPRFDFDEER